MAVVDVCVTIVLICEVLVFEVLVFVALGDIIFAVVDAIVA
jgi:hypothetical protein